MKDIDFRYFSLSGETIRRRIEDVLERMRQLILDCGNVADVFYAQQPIGEFPRKLVGPSDFTLRSFQSDISKHRASKGRCGFPGGGVNGLFLMNSFSSISSGASQ